MAERLVGWPKAQRCRRYGLSSNPGYARYLAEYDFRSNNRVALGVSDEARADRAMKGVVGKRLTYRAADSAANI
jgi:hypothetical protein